MSTYYVGQIMLSGFGFAPRNFALCNGQTLPVAQYQALFSLLGTSYGGNGTTTFMLPDLRGRTPVGYGGSTGIGANFGVESVTLNTTQVPAHQHAINATMTAGALRDPANSLYGAPSNGQAYASASSNATLLYAQQMQFTGGNQPHPNLQPYNTLNFSMCLNGIYPSRG